MPQTKERLAAKCEQGSREAAPTRHRCWGNCPVCGLSVRGTGRGNTRIMAISRTGGHQSRCGCHRAEGLDRS